MAGLRTHSMNELNQEAVQKYFEITHQGDAPSKLRNAALESFLEKGFPSKRVEAWHYTDLTLLNNFPFKATQASQKSNDIPEELAQVLKNWKTSGVVDLAIAMSRDIQVITVNENEQQDVVIKSAGADSLRLPVYFIQVGKGASVNIIDESGDDIEHVNSLVAVVLAAESQVKHYFISDQPSKLSTQTYFIEQDEKSSYELHGFISNAAKKRAEWHIGLNGPYADVKLNNIMLGVDKNHLDIQFEVEHRAPHCTSEQVARAIMDDKSKGVFNGRVKVFAGADKSDAYQNSRNLLLSSRAEINTKPELEIYADDVKCAHGATAGELDEDALFYLKSRGIDEHEAINLLTYAFVECLLDKISSEEIKERLKQKVEHVLGRMVKT